MGALPLAQAEPQQRVALHGRYIVHSARPAVGARLVRKLGLGIQPFERSHAMKDQIVRPATIVDVPGITACVCEAYVHYIERIGKRPGPMLEDFVQTIDSAQVHVIEYQGQIIGVAVFKITDEGFYLDNVAVRPSAKGTGVGRTLLELAEHEASIQGYTSIYLATHELMHENRTLYARIGYKECDHRVVNGYPRVMMRKPLQ